MNIQTLDIYNEMPGYFFKRFFYVIISVSEIHLLL